MVNDAVKILFSKKMIMTAKEDRHIIFDHELMDRFSPARARLIESSTAVFIQPTPFIISGILTAATSLGVFTANQLVTEDKRESCAAVFQRLLEPEVLLIAESPVPVISTFSWFGRCIPIRTQDDKQRIAPLEGVIVFTRFDDVFK